MVSCKGMRELLSWKHTAWVLTGLITELPLMKQSILNRELITTGEQFCNYGLRQNTNKTSVSETLPKQQHNYHVQLLQDSLNTHCRCNELSWFELHVSISCIYFSEMLDRLTPLLAVKFSKAEVPEQDANDCIIQGPFIDAWFPIDNSTYNSGNTFWVGA